MSVRSVADQLHLPRLPWSWQTLERATLFLVLAFYGIGDVLTSVISMSIGGEESTAFVQAFVDAFGLPGLVVHKLLLLAIVAVAWYAPTLPGRLLDVDPRPFRIAIAGMFAARGVALVTWNSYVIYLLATGSGYAFSPF